MDTRNILLAPMTEDQMRSRVNQIVEASSDKLRYWASNNADVCKVLQELANDVLHEGIVWATKSDNKRTDPLIRSAINMRELLNRMMYLHSRGETEKILELLTEVQAQREISGGVMDK